MKRRTLLLCVLLFFLTLSVRLIFLSNNQQNADSCRFIDLAFSMADGGEYTPSHFFVGFPVFEYFLAVLAKLSLMFNLPANLLFNFNIMLVSSLGVVPLFLLGKRLFNEKVGLVSALLLCLSPVHIYYSSITLADAFGTTFFISSLCLLFSYLKNNKRVYISFAGLFLALSVGVRYPLITLFPLFILLLFLSRKVRHTLLYFLPVSLIVMFFLFFNAIASFSQYSPPVGTRLTFFAVLYCLYIFLRAIGTVPTIVFLISSVYMFKKRKKVAYKLGFLILVYVSSLFFFKAIVDRMYIPILPIVWLFNGFLVVSVKNKSLKYFLVLLLIVPTFSSIDINIPFLRSMTQQAFYMEDSSVIDAFPDMVPTLLKPKIIFPFSDFYGDVHYGFKRVIEKVVDSTPPHSNVVIGAYQDIVRCNDDYERLFPRKTFYSLQPENLNESNPIYILNTNQTFIGRLYGFASYPYIEYMYKSKYNHSIHEDYTLEEKGDFLVLYKRET